MQCVYVNLHAPTYIKVIYPTARDIAQAAYRRALSKKGEPSQSGRMEHVLLNTIVPQSSGPYVSALLCTQGHPPSSWPLLK